MVCCFDSVLRLVLCLYYMCVLLIVLVYFFIKYFMAFKYLQKVTLANLESELRARALSVSERELRLQQIDKELHASAVSILNS